MTKSKEEQATEKLISYYRLSKKELDAESILEDYRRISEEVLADELELDKVNKKFIT